MLKKISIIIFLISLAFLGLSIKQKANIAKLDKHSKEIKQILNEKRKEFACIEIYGASEGPPLKESYDTIIDTLFSEAELMNFKAVTKADNQEDFKRIDNYISESELIGVRQLSLTTKVSKSGTDPILLFYFVRKISSFPVEIKSIKYNKNGWLEVKYVLYGI